MVQLLQRCFDPTQRVSTFQPARTGVFELPRIPHSFFDFVDLFLINEEKAGRFSEPRDLRGEGEVMNVLESVVETRSFVSAMLESPQVIIGVPWPLP